MAKQKRRGNNEGSITQRKDGRFQGYVHIGVNYESGTAKRKYVYGKTKKEVKDKMKEIEVKLHTGNYIEPSKLRVDSMLDMWLAGHKNSIKETTLTNYYYLIETHIKPTIGYILLKDLDTHTLQVMYNEKFKNGRVDGKGGLSPNTIERMHAVIHESLEKAITYELILKNVSDNVDLPRKQRNKAKIFTIEEQNTFYKAIKGHRLEVAFTLLLATGMRTGELFALKWENVNLETKIIKIRSTYSRVLDLDGPDKYKSIYSEPKTEASNRDIDIIHLLVPILMEHKRKQIEEKDLMGSKYQDVNLVISTSRGTPMIRSNFHRDFKKILTSLDLPDIRLHDLRHTFTSRAIEGGLNPKSVQSILGHSTMSMTLNTYAHISENEKKKDMAKLDYLFQRSEEKDPSVEEKQELYMVV